MHPSVVLRRYERGPESGEGPYYAMTATGKQEEPSGDATDDGLTAGHAHAVIAPAPACGAQQQP